MTLWMMSNYEPVSVYGSVFYKLGHLPQATEGNAFGPRDPQAYEVEDSAFGMIRMKDGSTIHLEASPGIECTGIQRSIHYAVRYPGRRGNQLRNEFQRR